MMPETGQGDHLSRDSECPVTANMSFGSHLVVSHVAVTVIMSSKTRHIACRSGRFRR
jgi:hypothetical protein